MPELARENERLIEKAEPVRLVLNRSGTLLLSLFLLTLLLLTYVWWPLAEEYLAYIDWSKPIWGQLDWLLIGIFLLMTVLIIAGADIHRDAWILLVGLGGGLVIEAWGTQAELWTYYTLERPPLWIIPAWPITSLSIDRLVRLVSGYIARQDYGGYSRVVYWLIFGSFYSLMLSFIWPTASDSLSIMALLFTALLILTPTDHRQAVITFTVGAGLGYFLERWGTTRACWTYYTGQTPPLFAVLAHGMAAVAFWRTGRMLQRNYYWLLAPTHRLRQKISKLA